MKINFKKYFTFRRKDQIGLITLSVLILIVFSADFYINRFSKADKQYDFSEFSSEIDSFIQSLVEIEDEEVYISKLDSFIIVKYDSLELFKFDPNVTSDQEWKLLGLTDKQITTINNYKNRGGKFFIKDDFRKIYGIRTMQYKILKPYIALPDDFVPDYNNSNYTSKNNFELFDFDPNKATDEDYKKLGLSEKQINTINNYKNKGGTFKTKEDFKKMYVISDEEYKRLEPYIVIKVQDDIVETVVPKDIPVVEINSSDTALLKQLPGIGPVLAERIVKFRDKLGGFYKIEQLKEVYGLTEETYQGIIKYVKIETSGIHKININFADYSELVIHPYINSQIANSILNYKKKNGFYTSINELKDKGIIEADVFEKIKNYITVE